MAQAEAPAVEVRKLTGLNAGDLDRLATGYTSPAKYQVHQAEAGGGWIITLQLAHLPQPYAKHYDPIDAVMIDHYRGLPPLGFSFGAYHQQECVGLVLAEPHQWNQSLWVWELHVSESRRGQGIGRQLIEALAQEGLAAGLRTLVCETQTTNVPAIDFYRKMGFDLEGVDLSYYSNNDYPDGEIALFMKKRLT